MARATPVIVEMTPSIVEDVPEAVEEGSTQGEESIEAIKSRPAPVEYAHVPAEHTRASAESMPAYTTNAPASAADKPKPVETASAFVAPAARMDEPARSVDAVRAPQPRLDHAKTGPAVPVADSPPAMEVDLQTAMPAPKDEPVDAPPPGEDAPQVTQQEGREPMRLAQVSSLHVRQGEDQEGPERVESDGPPHQVQGWKPRPAPDSKPESAPGDRREPEPEHVPSAGGAQDRPSAAPQHGQSQSPGTSLPGPLTSEAQPPTTKVADAPETSIVRDARADADVERPAQPRTLSFIRVSSATPSGGNVELIARQRGGAIEATVRPSDPALQTLLQRNLPADMNELRSSGIAAIEFLPAHGPARPISQSTSLENGERHERSPSSQHNPQPGGSPDRRDRHRHAWDTEDLELQ